MTNLKTTFFRKKPTSNLIATFLSQINLDEQAITKINTYSIYKGDLGGGGGASPTEAEEIFKKSNKMAAFPWFSFFAFRQGSLNPQNYELAPKLP